MFKVPKHKQRRPFRGSKKAGGENDEDEDKKNRKRHRKPMLTSFAENNETEEYMSGDDDGKKRDVRKNDKKEFKKKKKKSKKSHSKSKKSGMGFGGGSISFLQSHEEEEEEHASGFSRRPMGIAIDDDHDHDTFNEKETFSQTSLDENNSTTNLYDKSAMQQLKLQQKLYSRPVNDNNEEKTHGEDPVVSTTVISGEEAIAHMINQSKQSGDNNVSANDNTLPSIHVETPISAETQLKNNLKDSDKSNDKNENDDDENSKRQWEEQVARRAGVPMPSSTSNSQSQQPSEKNIQKKDSSELMEELQSSIQQTLSKLRSTKEICESKLRQQKVEEQTLTLENEYPNPNQLGLELEYYQKLRFQLVSWIGALRYMQSDILHPTIQAMHQYYQSHHSPINNNLYMTNTIIPSLQKMDIVESFLYPAHLIKPLVSINTQQQTHVQELDEFGRDITSIKQRKKDKSRQERRLVLQQSRYRRPRPNPNLVSMWDQVENDYKDEDMENSDFDILQRQENRILLTDAVKIALDTNLDEEYFDIPSLLEVFKQWHQHHTSPHTNNNEDSDKNRKNKQNDPNYYDSCYATMSLADLLSVLVQIQLCQYWDLNATPNNSQNGTRNDQTKTLLTFSVQDMPWYGQIKSFDLVDNNQHKEEMRTESNFKSGLDSKKLGLSSSTTLLFQIVCQKALVPWLNFFFPRKQNDNDDNFHGNQFEEGKDEETFWTFNPFSSIHTRALSTLFSFLQMHMSFPNSADNKKKQDEKYLLQLQENLVNYLFHYLQCNVCIPILKSKNTMTINLLNKCVHLTEDEISTDADINEEHLEAFTFATIGTVTLMEKLLLNVLTYWYPVINDEAQRKRLSKWILSDIVSNRVLPTLSLWREIDGNPKHEMNDNDKSIRLTEKGSNGNNMMYAHGTSRASTILKSIVKSIQMSGMLDDNDLMLHAAPLRVSAAMHNIQIDA